MVKQRRAWHAIIAFGQHRQSNDIRRGMPSSPLDGKHGRTTLGVACHHCLWAAQTIERRRAWHAIIALGRQRWSNNIGRGMPLSPLASTHSRTTSGVACHHRLWAAHTVERCRVAKTSPPLVSTHGRTTSSVARHHHLWAAHTIERRRAWHAIIAFKAAHTVERRRVWNDIIALGQHTRWNDVRRGRTSPPLDGTHGRTTSGIA